jgi:hypothetical protein
MMLLQVMSEGVYEVVIMYTSAIEATFRLAVGEYNSIMDGSSPSITSQLPTVVSAPSHAVIMQALPSVANISSPMHDALMLLACACTMAAT